MTHRCVIIEHHGDRVVCKGVFRTADGGTVVKGVVNSLAKAECYPIVLLGELGEGANPHIGDEVEFLDDGTKRLIAKP